MERIRQKKRQQFVSFVGDAPVQHGFQAGLQCSAQGLAVQAQCG